MILKMSTEVPGILQQQDRSNAMLIDKVKDKVKVDVELWKVADIEQSQASQGIAWRVWTSLDIRDK